MSTRPKLVLVAAVDILVLLAFAGSASASSCGIVYQPNWELHVRTNGADCAAARDIARKAHRHNPSYPARVNFGLRGFPRFAYRRYLKHGPGYRYKTFLRSKYCTSAVNPYCAWINSYAYSEGD